jgi:hypothetical protein
MSKALKVLVKFRESSGFAEFMAFYATDGSDERGRGKALGG